MSNAEAITDLFDFIDSSPSPYHAVATACARLGAAGFVELDEREAWDTGAGNWYLRRGGSVVAWSTAGETPTEGFRIVGAHTDSPNLRIKPQPDTGSAGYRQLGVEVYGGVLLNSWLDRDLGLSGRVTTRVADGVETKLIRIDEPILRIPQLAIHLNREIRDKGLNLNSQSHMAPVWGLGDVDPELFRRTIAEAASIDAGDILSWDLMCHDLTPSALVGLEKEFIAAPRIDNQLSCWAALDALVAADQAATTAMVCLFDHEEVGSTSSVGADSALLPTILERIVLAAGGTRDDFFRAMAKTLCVSADGAHATHPNYADRHEPNHTIALNAGPVIKINSNQRYATTSMSHGAFLLACEEADVPHQKFVTRTDLACGSTIGPVTSARLGVSTVDVGAPQLAMHSSRETAGAHDAPMFAKALTAFFGSAALA